MRCIMHSGVTEVSLSQSAKSFYLGFNSGDRGGFSIGVQCNQPRGDDGSIDNFLRAPWGDVMAFKDKQANCFGDEGEMLWIASTPRALPRMKLLCVCCDGQTNSGAPWYGLWDPCMGAWAIAYLKKKNIDATDITTMSASSRHDEEILAWNLRSEKEFFIRILILKKIPRKINKNTKKTQEF